MLIAHLPATYLALRALGPLPRRAFLCGLAGGVAPDLDILWFVFVDHGQHHHHGYLTHRPALWALALVVLLVLSCRWPGCRTVALLPAAALLHLVLDSLCGRIAWGWPLSAHAAPLVVVPARHGHWVANFTLHWTFAIELTLTALATIIMIQKEKPGDKAPG